MNEIMKKENINIEDKIYKINGVEVMLDSDLAELYHVETKRINEAVKNNPDKFPERYSWVLNETSIQFLRSKISTLEIKGQGKYSKYLPRVFTEQGVYMLATILKSKVATEVSINIMDTFVKMRKCIMNNKEFLPNRVLLLEEKVDNNTKSINMILNKFNNNDIKKQILFEGQIYDSYSVLMDILSKSVEEIIIIDNYTGKELLDILRDINRKIIIVSKNINETLKKKYEKQYSNVTFIKNDSFHDRFIIIDRTILYTCGASFKDLGKKCFSINRFDDIEYLNKILDTIKICYN